MAERAAARAWRDDVHRRTAPVGETEHARRRAAGAREATRPRRRSGERDAAARPALSLVVTRTDEDAPRRDPATGRRTVEITGQRPAPAPRRRPDAASRVGPRPDRIAMWAFFMGIFLVGVATATADAAPL